MMGFSFNRPVEAHELFDRFRGLSERNRDGWGVGFYTDASPTVFKEPVPVAQSSLAETLIADRLVKSKLFIHNLAEPDETWTRIPPGHLAVFKDGRVVYRSDATEETEP